MPVPQSLHRHGLRPCWQGVHALRFVFGFGWGFGLGLDFRPCWQGVHAHECTPCASPSSLSYALASPFYGVRPIQTIFQYRSKPLLFVGIL
jgi:hypothetical protein